ncbi:hypothetical protein ASG92_25560 [Arthrobacter sp. Soil736]|nr:hypothetical protein ASG92_25560 [Arthrobacter sp. Soil736]
MHASGRLLSLLQAQRSPVDRRDFVKALLTRRKAPPDQATSAETSTTMGSTRVRRSDVDIRDLDRVAHEVKSGYVKYQSSITRQIEKDAILARTEGTGINGAVWHFVASDRSGTIGADPRILDLVEENGINYVIHLP